MGIEEETDRTVFIRNLDTKVTEELLFELFLQAGPLVKTKIPKDSDGRQKTFGFAVYKHDVSVPYAVQLLNGTMVNGRNIHVQFRSGSSHCSNPGNSQNSSPASTPNPHGQRTPAQFSSPPYTPPHQMQRSFSSPDNLQKHAMMNNMMWQTQMKQMDQLNGSLKPPQRQTFGGGKSASGDLRHHDNTPYRHHASQNNSTGRSQRYAEEPGSGRHQQHSHGRESHHHHQHQSNRSGNRHYDNRGGNRPYDDRGSNRGYQDSRWQRY